MAIGPITADAPDEQEIHAAVLARLQALRPLVDEYVKLEAADRALDQVPLVTPRRGRPPQDQT